MTIDEYRIMLGWSKQQLADEAGVDITTIYNALDPKRRIYRATASKIAIAINKGLRARQEPEIKYTDFSGLQFAD